MIITDPIKKYQREFALGVDIMSHRFNLRRVRRVFNCTLIRQHDKYSFSTIQQ